MTASLRYRPSGYLSARMLAELLQPVAAETPYGGQVVSYEALGVVWLKIAVRGQRRQTEAGLTSGVETATAETRTDPRLTEGRVLRFGGNDWTLVGVEPQTERPGRTFLKLETTR